jgi:hypothetical protein
MPAGSVDSEPALRPIISGMLLVHDLVSLMSRVSPDVPRSAHFGDDLRCRMKSLGGSVHTDRWWAMLAARIISTVPEIGMTRS